MATIVQRGDRWQAQVRKTGETSSSKTFANRKDAVVWARGQEHRLDRGERPDAARRVTFGELVAAYRGQTAAVRAFSRSKDQAIAAIEKDLGARRLAEFRVATFNDFAGRREAQGAGPATILQDLSYISTIIRHAGPVLGLETSSSAVLASLRAARSGLGHAGRIARPKERQRRPTGAEIAALDVVWRRNPRLIPMQDIVPFAIATAMRLSEIVGLLWADLDEADRTILIRNRKHPRRKAGNDQLVPLLRGPTVIGGAVVDPLEIILRQPRKGPRIFPYGPQSVSTAFQRATKIAGIDDLNFHDCRHDGASRLFEAGYAIEQVALVTGHRSWDSLRRYTQLRAVDLHRDVK